MTSHSSAQSDRQPAHGPLADAPAALSAAAQRLVAGETRHLLLWLSRQERLQRLTAEFAPARRAARRWVAGETRSDALATVASLAAQGLTATVAYLGEHAQTRPEVAQAVTEVRALLRELRAAGHEPNCSVKLSQLGLHFDEPLAESSLRTLVAEAAAVDGFVRIDMEGSDLTEQTLALYERVRPASGERRVGVVIQSYLRRAEADVRHLIEHGAAVRLVKGAYDEPEERAYPDKHEVDAAYVRLVDLLLSPEARAAGVYPAFATHDPAMIAAVRTLASERAIAADGYEFQMLLGIRRDLQTRLRREDQRVRIYVPYGDQWYPYFMRRLAERPANLGFLLRSLREGRAGEETR